MECGEVVTGVSQVDVPENGIVAKGYRRWVVWWAGHAQGTPKLNGYAAIVGDRQCLCHANGCDYDKQQVDPERRFKG